MADEPSAERSAERSAEHTTLKSYEWKFVNGRLLRCSRTLPHERAVSARYDAEGRGILPRLNNEPRGGPRRRMALYKEAERVVRACANPTEVMHDVAVSQQKHDPCQLAHRSPQTEAAINWDSGQLHFLTLPSMPPSPKKISDHHDARGSWVSDDVDVGSREQRAFARPSNRSEAIQLAENLERKLQDSESDLHATQRSWQITFCEIVRQVGRTSIAVTTISFIHLLLPFSPRRCTCTVLSAVSCWIACADGTNLNSTGSMRC